MPRLADKYPKAHALVDSMAKSIIRKVICSKYSQNRQHLELLKFDCILDRNTVKPVSNGHTQKDQKLVFKTNYCLMKVKSITEC